EEVVELDAREGEERLDALQLQGLRERLPTGHFHGTPPADGHERTERDRGITSTVRGRYTVRQPSFAGIAWGWLIADGARRWRAQSCGDFSPLPCPRSMRARGYSRAVAIS